MRFSSSLKFEFEWCSQIQTSGSKLLLQEISWCKPCWPELLGSGAFQPMGCESQLVTDRHASFSMSADRESGRSRCFHDSFRIGV